MEPGWRHNTTSYFDAFRAMARPFLTNIWCHLVPPCHLSSHHRLCEATVKPNGDNNTCINKFAKRKMSMSDDGSIAAHAQHRRRAAASRRNISLLLISNLLVEHCGLDDNNTGKKKRKKAVIRRRLDWDFHGSILLQESQFRRYYRMHYRIYRWYGPPGAMSPPLCILSITGF